MSSKDDIERLRTAAKRDLAQGLDARSINAELNLWGKDRTLQLDKDKEAEQAYIISEVEPNTKRFGTEHERFHWLVDNDYYEHDLIDYYDDGFIDSIHAREHAAWVSFGSFMGVFKFYQQYAMRTGDGKTYLEDFVERAVAVALKLAAGDKDFAVKLADAIVNREYQPATPTFLNAGKVRRGEYTSCFLLNVDDSMESIGRSVNSALQLSKRGGGVALGLTDLRELGAPIKGIDNAAAGVVPVMKILEDSFSYANQLGARQGAGAVYLHMCHPDILRFLDTKRENADEKIRIKTLSIGIVVPDVAFRLAKENKDMALFSPYAVKKHYGKTLSRIGVSEHYDELAADDRVVKGHVNVRKLFTTIAELQFESGYPYLMFEDTVNRENPLDGRIVMSNLCVTGDTRLLTTGGYKRAKDLYDSQEAITVLSDNRVLTGTMEESSLSPKQSTTMQLTKRNAKIVKVITKEGFELKATLWHKFHVNENDTIVTKHLGELEVGDRILVQPSEGSYGIIHHPDLAYLAGLIAADGSFAHHVNAKTGNESVSAIVYLYSDKDEVKDRVSIAIDNVLDGRDDLIERQAKLTAQWTHDDHADRWSLHSAPLAKLLDEYGMTYHNKMEIPEFVREGDKETQVAYLNGVFQMDSCITGSLKAHNIGAELGSINHDFLRDIQVILINMGIYSRIYTSKSNDSVEMLPDGKGGFAPYMQHKSWSLRIHSENMYTLYHTLTWLQRHVDAWNDLGGNDRNFYKSRHVATVTELEPCESEDSYDVTVQDGHSVIFDGISTGNCSEITQIQEPSEYNEDLSYDKVGLDVSCNLGSLNIARAFESGKLADVVNIAFRSLVQVSRMTDTGSVPSLKRANDTMHSVGLGEMNLHGFLMSHGIAYGSPAALAFVDAYFRTIAYHVIKTNNAIAMESGQTFDGFNRSKYADGSYFERFISRTKPIADPSIAGMFAQYHVDVPTVDDWERLRDSVVEHGLYCSYLQAIPPTGSISYLNGSTSSIHPVAAAIEIRKEGKTGRVYYPAYGLTNENVNDYKDAYQIGPRAIIDTYAAAQPYVDQSMSLTLFYPDTATTRDLVRNYAYAWVHGIKSTYYLRLRQSALNGTEIQSNVSECISCQL